MALVKDDFETLCDVVANVIKAGLNTRLSAIDSEKNDGITLKTVSESAYYFHDLNSSEINFDPFIFIQVYNIEGDGGISPHSATAASVEILVAIVLQDVAELGGALAPVSRLMYRYQRAIREIIEEGFDSGPIGSKLSVQSLMPIDVKLLSRSGSYKSIGVLVRLEWG